MSVFQFLCSNFWKYFEYFFANKVISLLFVFYLLLGTPHPGYSHVSSLPQNWGHLLEFCGTNSILLQASKCWFTVINGTAEDRLPLQVGNNNPIKYAEHLEILVLTYQLAWFFLLIRYETKKQLRGWISQNLSATSSQS